MRFHLQLAVVIGLVFGCAVADKARFDNYRVYRLKVDTEEQLEVLQQIESFPDGYSFWESPFLNKYAEIVVPPHKFGEISELFERFNFEYDLKITNVQALIESEQPRIAPSTFGWKAYYNLDQIYEWIDEQLVAYPEILTNLTVGQSYQGRTIRALKLSHNASNPTIFIESTIHAREWVTVSTATYLLNELLTSNDPEIQALARTINWVFVPVLNVDGYVYTHSYNRMWRKTRKPSAKICYGTDANRNFDFHFAEAGVSPNPCSETYPGPHPFSENETAALANFTRTIDIKMYISFHAYGQYLMYPYGHTSDSGPNANDLRKISKLTTAAIAKRYNTDYISGSIADAIYKAAGGSIDWIYGVLKVPLSFVFEFRDHRQGRFGFILPADQIIPNCLEFMDGLKAMVQAARSLNYF